MTTEIKYYLFVSWAREINRSDLKAYGVITAVSYLVAVLIFKDFLFTPGIVNTGDMVWPYFRSQSHEYTTTLHQLPNHIPYFSLLWSLPGSTAVLQRILYVTVYTLIGTIGGSVVYAFVKEDVEQTTAARLGVMGSLLYLLNPINVFQATQIFLLIGYALFPLVIYLAYSACASPQVYALRYGLLFGIVLTSMSGDPRWPVWGFISIGILLTIDSIIKEDTKMRAFNSLNIMAISGISFLALSAFWLVPLFHPDGWTAANPLTDQNLLSKQVIDMLNRDSTWINALRFHADWWPPLRRGFIPSGTPWQEAWYISGIVLPIIAIGSLLLKRKRILPLAILYVCFLFLATAPTSSFEIVQEMYDMVVFHAPFGAAFRTAFKWLLPASFPLVLMASIGVGTLCSSDQKHRKIVGFTLIILLVVSAATNSWLLFIGDLGGERQGFVPRQIPEEERQKYQTIQDDLGEHTVLAIPHEPSYGLPMRTVGRDSFRKRITELAANNETNTRDAILRQVSVRYLIDSRGEREREIQKIRGAQRTAHIPDVVISGELDDSYSLQRSIGLDNTSIVTGQRTTNAEYQFVSSSRDAAFDDGTRLQPHKHTYNADPNSGWARTTLSAAYVVNNLQAEQLTRRETDRGLLVTSTNNSIEIPFSVDKDGNYKVLARYFEGPEGGAIRVLIDGESRDLETKDQLSGFVEDDLGTFELEEGRHTLTLVNVNGENAISAFSVLAEERYKEAHHTHQRAIENKTLIHLLEAQSDLYVNRGGTQNEEINRSNIINGSILEMNEGTKAHTSVQIQTNSTYRPAVRGDGSFTVRIDNYTYNVQNDGSQYKNLEPIELSAGRHNISVTADEPGTLDMVWLSSNEENKSLEDSLSSEKTDAHVESIERVSATRYKVSVDANEQYMLSFAEDYSPLWTAEVQSANGTKRYDPVPVYSSINGFYINETGEHTVIIRYRPQQWYFTGSVVSIVSLIACMGYIIYDQRRRSNN